MFEYKIINDSQNVEKTINELADLGWRLVAVIPEGTYRSGRVLLERRKVGAQTGRMRQKGI